MKKLILFTAFLSLSIFGSYAQTIKDEPDCLKGIHNVWKAGFSFQQIKNAENMEERKSELLVVIKTSYNTGQSYYEKLAGKYGKNENLEQLELHLGVIQKAYQSILTENWINDPTWQFSYLILLDLLELELSTN